MKNVVLTFLALLLATVATVAQTARVQVIHNSPDPTVDVYAGTALLLNDLAFRTATPFVDLPAGDVIAVGVAPSTSTSSADAIFTQNVTFEAGGTYVVSASGVVFNATTPFQLIAQSNAREAATNPAKVDFAVLHGSPDAPAVDVAVRTGSTIVANLAFGEFTSYLSVDPGVYYLDVKPAGTNNIVQTYKADLSGLAGQSAYVFASGFLTPGAGVPFGLFAALADGTVVEFPAEPVARVQVIHNSPSPTVDVWANGALLLDNFEFRTATPFVYLPAGVDITLAVAPDTSTSAASALASFPVNLANGSTYIVAAQGIVNDPLTGFNLNINPAGREKSAAAGKVDVGLLHGSPNAPAVDVTLYNSTTQLFTNVAYGETRPYLSLDPGVYYIDVKPAGGSTAVATFKVDLSTLGNQAVYVFASGLLFGDPAFGLYAALPNGTVVALPQETPPPAPTARVQIVHNSPTPTVDVYVGETLLLDDFEFRTATPFIDVPAGVELTIGVAPSTSTSSADAIATFPVTLDADGTYIVTASGIVGNATTPFTLIVNPTAQEAATNAAKVDVAVLHGSPDAPAVDVALYNTTTPLISDLAYGEFTPYLSLDPGLYYLDVKPAGTQTVVATFKADLSTLAGGAGYVFASGLLGGSPAFGLYVALPDGTVIALPQETPPPALTARVQIIHNSPNPTVDVYLGEDLLLDDFAFRTATPFVDVPAGVELTVGVALPNSQSVNDVIASFPVTFEANETYIVVASGVVGNPTTPFTLNVNPAGQEAATNAAKVDVAVLHGSTNAPAIDVDEVFTGNLISDLSYGEFTPYLSLDPGIYDLALRPTGNPTVIVTYRADLTALAGEAAYVFASGFVGGSGATAFGLYAAFPDGTVVALPGTPISRVQVVHNSPEPTVDVYAGNVLLLDDFEFRTATPFVALPADRDFVVGVAPATSTSAADAIATFPVNFESTKSYTVFAAGLVGGNPGFGLFVADDARETAASGITAVSVFHGAPGAPAVDVVERLGGPVVEDLAFGEFTPYLNLPSGAYLLDVKPAGSETIVQTYLADLSTLGGLATRVFASGILGGSPAFGLFAVLPDGTVVELPASPVARVQIIHNSPSPTVDVYAGTDLLIDDFEYQTATEFVYLPAGVEIPVGVALGNSQSSNDVIATFPVTFENGKTYVVAASGIVGNATTPFTLIVNDAAREAAENPAALELAILHGATDAPAVDLVPFGEEAALLSGLAYGDFTDYLALAPGEIILDVVPSANPSQVVGTWGGNFNGTAGLAGVVMASGLLAGDPDFDLLLVLADGTVLPLPSFARAQVIHNSPSPTVDVYFDDIQVLEDFEFRTATGIGLLPARTPFVLSVAPSTSTSVDDAIYELPVTELETGRTYVIVAAGEVGGAEPFQLYVNANGRDRSQSGNNVELALFHGAPNAPEVDVTLPTNTPIFDNIEFGEFSDYVSVPPASYVVNVTPANDNQTIVATYVADVTGIAGQAATVFASGYLNPTGQQPGFEVWVALIDGTTFPLPPFVSTNQLDQQLSNLRLAPNPTSDQLWVRFQMAEQESLRYTIRDVAGRSVQAGSFGDVAAGEFAQQLEVANLESGLYLLDIQSNTGTRTVRFVVQR